MGDAGSISGQGIKIPPAADQLSLHATARTKCSQLNKQTKQKTQDFPCGSMDKNLPANAGDIGSIPGAGRFHICWATKPGETVETVSDFILGGSKITADGDCSHEIKRRLLLRRKVMTNLDSILKSRDITLPTKVRLVKAMVFPVVMYGCESWTMKKAEC